jgi:hypothetical protein
VKCPYCGGGASFATFKGEPRICGHPCPKLDDRLFYWHLDSVVLFGSVEAAQQAHARQQATAFVASKWLGEVFELVNAETRRWPDWLRIQHGLEPASAVSVG